MEQIKRKTVKERIKRIKTGAVLRIRDVIPFPRTPKNAEF